MASSHPGCRCGTVRRTGDTDMKIFVVAMRKVIGELA